MSPAQTRVMVLLLVLLGLELVVHPGVGSFFQNAWTSVNSAIYAETQKGFTMPFGAIPPTTQPTGKNTQPGTISKVGTQCPPGQKFVPIAGGTTGTCR